MILAGDQARALSQYRFRALTAVLSPVNRCWKKLKTANSSRVMTYELGWAWTLPQIWASAPSRILLMVGSDEPSGLSRAISSAWATLASCADLAEAAAAAAAAAAAVIVSKGGLPMLAKVKKGISGCGCRCDCDSDTERKGR